MTSEIFLAIVSFAISVGGLASILMLDKDALKRRIVITIIISVLAVSSGYELASGYTHQKLLDRTEEAIIEKLSGNSWTFDRIFSEVIITDFTLVSEALYQGVMEKRIGDQVKQVRGPDGEMINVRFFYVK